MKVLITGANGFLGQHLIDLLLRETQWTILATGRGASRLSFESNSRYCYASLDITDGWAVNRFFEEHRPDVVVHAAAMTQPDPCELNKPACWLHNVTATRFLLDAATITKSRFIYISTDFVFDGSSGPYRETDATAPVNYYGSSKLAAEKAVLESKLDSCIIRTVLVYGPMIFGTRSNVVSWVAEHLRNHQPIKVVGDQIRTPTFVKDLAKGVYLAMQYQSTGIYHVSGQDVLTPYDMAIATANYFNLNAELITKVTADTFTQPAVRPLRTGFIIDKARCEWGFEPISFSNSLALMELDL